MTFDTVTLDLDGTLLPGTTAFAEVLKDSPRAEAVRESDRRYFSGESSLRDVFFEQWQWVRELDLPAVEAAMERAAWLPGIAEGVARLRSAGLEVRLLTDQPITLTGRLQAWGIDSPICSPVTTAGDRQVEIDFREDKLTNLRAAGLQPDRVCHVGNGSNDVPVWNAGATGVAVFASPEVAQEATVDLGALGSMAPIVDAVLGLHGAAAPSSLSKRR